MPPFPVPPARPGSPGRLLLLLAAVDSAAAGAWALARPADLFALLGAAPARDGLLLGRVLGALTLGHVPCLVLGSARPPRWGGLVAVPLLGRALLAGVWLWLLGTDRVSLPHRPLLLLLAHDAFWAAGCAGFLLARRCSVVR
jgi:hypothetical protein